MKKALTSASLLFLGISSLQAQIAVDINVNRIFELTTPTVSKYLSGDTNISISDGSFSLSPCAFHPSLVIVGPDPIFCPLGTTAFIQAGDIDEDGISDLRAYWSVASVTKAILIDPFNSTNITLAAAPPSTLARPRSEFIDGSVAMYYNVLSPPIELKDIAKYTYSKTYGVDEFKQHSDEWVPGIYIYSIPVIDRFFQHPGLKTNLNIQLTQMIEPNGYRKGLEGFMLDTTQWRNNAQELDPRIVSTMKWRGNTSLNTLASDLLEFGIEDDMGDLVYPTFDLLYKLSNPYLRQLAILPYAFTKGDVGKGVMSFTRSVSTTTVATDTSTRLWKWPMRFVDTFKGHTQFEHRFVLEAAYPGIKVQGKIDKLNAPTADYDGDGMSNIFEFAFSKDDGDDLNTTLEYSAYNDLVPPTPLYLTSLGLTAPLPGNAPVYTDVSAPLAIPYTVNKRKNVGSSVTYGYEVTYDALAVKPKWTKLKAPVPGTSVIVKDSKAGNLVGNPNFTWTITDTFDVGLVTGTTTIQASNALPASVRVRSTAEVTSGY